MARNGSGVFTLPYPTFTPNTVAKAEEVTANNTDITTEITNSIAADGQTLPTANLPMGGFRHTGVGDASAGDEYLSAKQAQNNAVHYAASVGGTANAITLTITPAPSAYTAGLQVIFKATGTSTGTVTIDVNGLGAKTVDLGSANGSPGQIVSGETYIAVYDGAIFKVGALTATLNGGDIVALSFTANGTNIDVSVGGDDANGDVLKWSHASDTAAWPWRLRRLGGDWVVDNANSASRQAMFLTSENTSQQMGTSAVQPYIAILPKFAIGEGANVRRMSNGTAAPTSGEYAKGDIVWNVNAAASGTAGWICTTAGTAGSTAVFKTFATIAA